MALVVLDTGMQAGQQYLHIMIVTELKKDELSVRTLAEILMK